MYDHKTGISVRKIDKEDLDDLLALKNESWWGTHKTLVINKTDQLKWYENLSSNDLFMMVMHEDQKLGICSFTNIDYTSRVCHMSGSGFRAATKKNFAENSWYCCIDFGFEILNMHRIEAEVLSYNIPAQKRNIDTIGMRVEGVKKQAVYKCGRYYDSILLALLRCEWEQDERVRGYEGESCNKGFDHVKMTKLTSRSRHC